MARKSFLPTGLIRITDPHNRMRPVKLIFISICLSVFLSSCETIVYWQNLPPPSIPRVVWMKGDSEPITPNKTLVSSTIFNLFLRPLPFAGAFEFGG